MSVKEGVKNMHRSKTIVANVVAVGLTVATTMASDKSTLVSILGEKWGSVAFIVALGLMNVGLRFATNTSLADKSPEA